MFWLLPYSITRCNCNLCSLLVCAGMARWISRCLIMSALNVIPKRLWRSKFAVLELYLHRFGWWFCRPGCRYRCGGGLLLSDCCDGLLEERPSETYLLFQTASWLKPWELHMCVPHTYYLLSLSFIWATACYTVFFPGVVAALVFGKVGVYLVRWRIFCSS